MKRRTIWLRLVCLAAVFGLAAASNLAAQAFGIINPCKCPDIKIRVDKKVGCDVGVVVIYPTLPSPIVTVSPGTEVLVPCEDGAQVTIVNCLIQKQELDATGCIFNVGADFGCCVDACLTIDPITGCATLDITPALGPCKPC